MSGDQGGQRADIWLFRARLFKSRALATRLIEGGGLRVERFGTVHRPRRSSWRLREADILVFHRGERLFRLRVTGLGERRGPAAEARVLYELEADKDDRNV
ncbi:MAG: S4 domain-containing protein [Pseudomonadota bacterium]